MTYKLNKGDIITYLTNFIDFRYQVDLIRSYCHENGKDETLTEYFLFMLHSNPALTMDLARYILDIKVKEYEIVRVFNKEGKLIFIY